MCMCFVTGRRVVGSEGRGDGDMDGIGRRKARGLFVGCGARLLMGLGGMRGRSIGDEEGKRGSGGREGGGG